MGRDEEEQEQEEDIFWAGYGLEDPEDDQQQEAIRQPNNAVLDFAAALASTNASDRASPRDERRVAKQAGLSGIAPRPAQAPRHRARCSLLQVGSRGNGHSSLTHIGVHERIALLQALWLLVPGATKAPDGALQA